MLAQRDHELVGEHSHLLASAGKTAVCSKVEVVDEEGRTAAVGEVGEVCVRGAHVMLGYWKNPDLTAQVLRDGWYHTGDMGYLDDEGFLFLVDRKNDLIITGGENVYPREVEEVLHRHPAVLEAAVVASKSDDWGETIHAVVVKRAGDDVNSEDLIAFC